MIRHFVRCLVLSDYVTIGTENVDYSHGKDLINVVMSSGLKISGLDRPHYSGFSAYSKISIHWIQKVADLHAIFPDISGRGLKEIRKTSVCVHTSPKFRYIFCEILTIKQL